MTAAPNDRAAASRLVAALPWRPSGAQADGRTTDPTRVVSSVLRAPGGAPWLRIPRICMSSAAPPTASCGTRSGPRPVGRHSVMCWPRPGFPASGAMWWTWHARAGWPGGSPVVEGLYVLVALDDQPPRLLLRSSSDGTWSQQPGAFFPTARKVAGRTLTTLSSPFRNEIHLAAVTDDGHLSAPSTTSRRPNRYCPTTSSSPQARSETCERPHCPRSWRPGYPAYCCWP